MKEEINLDLKLNYIATKLVNFKTIESTNSYLINEIKKKSLST